VLSTAITLAGGGGGGSGESVKAVQQPDGQPDTKTASAVQQTSYVNAKLMGLAPTTIPLHLWKSLRVHFGHSMIGKKAWLKKFVAHRRAFRTEGPVALKRL